MLCFRKVCYSPGAFVRTDSNTYFRKVLLGHHAYTAAAVRTLALNHSCEALYARKNTLMLSSICFSRARFGAVLVETFGQRGVFAGFHADHPDQRNLLGR